MVVSIWGAVNPLLVDHDADESVETNAEIDGLETCEHDQGEAVEEDMESVILELHADDAAGKCGWRYTKSVFVFYGYYLMGTHHSLSL